VKNKIDTEYYLNRGNIDHKNRKLNIINDLGVTFDRSMSFQLKINKACNFR